MSCHLRAVESFPEIPVPATKVDYLEVHASKDDFFFQLFCIILKVLLDIWPLTSLQAFNNLPK